MQGLILAAGVARRLYPITEKTPKCLLEIGGKPILSHQLDALRQYNVNEITIVLGYFKEMVVNYIIDNYPDMDFTFITNEHFFETNTSYSVYLCSEKLVSTETVLMNGDVLYPPALLKRIIESQFDSVLAVDVKECGREEVKVIEGDGNRLVAIGKELIQENSLGEFIGVAKLSKSFCIAFSASLSRLIDAGGNQIISKQQFSHYWMNMMFIMKMLATYPVLKLILQKIWIRHKSWSRMICFNFN